MRWPLPSPAHRDYRALALGKIPDWGWDLKDFKSPCLYQVADTFNYHLVRTSTFALMPAWIALESIREQLWLDYLAVKDGRQLNPDLMAYVSSPAASPDTQKGH